MGLIWRSVQRKNATAAPAKRATLPRTSSASSAEILAPPRENNGLLSGVAESAGMSHRSKYSWPYRSRNETAMPRTNSSHRIGGRGFAGSGAVGRGDGGA